MSVTIPKRYETSAPQALLLDGGRIIERGDPNTVVNKYYALIAERERTYSEGNLIEHGEVPGEGYETVYDFVRNLSEAKIESAKGMPVQLTDRRDPVHAPARDLCTPSFTDYLYGSC